MTTNIPPRVVIIDHLTDNGPTKVSVLAKAAGIGETTTRKVLHLLKGEGKVRQVGALWTVADETTAAPTPREEKVSGETNGTRHGAAAERDEAVFAYLTEHGAQTRNAIAEHFGVKPSEAYLSLFRLRKADRIVKIGETWTAIEG